MKLVRWSGLAGIVLAAPVAAQYPAALRQDAASPATAAQAVQVLKAHYFHQDFTGGADAAGELTRRFPRSGELRAWHVVNLSRLDAREDDALALVDSAPLWTTPNDRWRDFARSFALSYQGNAHDKAIAFARRVRRPARWDHDAVWLHGYVLHRGGKYADVVALADSATRARGPWGEILVLKANAQSQLAATPAPDVEARRRSAATFAEARRIEPSNVNAHYLPAANLSAGPTDTVAFALLRRAVEMTPGMSVHERYWSAVRARRDLPASQKDSIVTADVEALLALRPRSSAVLRAAYDAYVTMKRPDRFEPLLTRLQADHPGSVDLEWVQYNRLGALQDSAFSNPEDSAAILKRWRQELARFAARPLQHEGIRGTALLWQYMHLLKGDSTVSADSLRRFGDLLIRYNPANPHITGVDLPLLVAERKGDFRWAERTLMAGDSLQRARMAANRERIVRDGGVGEYADRLDAITATTHGGLGWIYLHEGRLEDAEREMKKALELNRKDPRLHFHLGKLAEARKQPLEAQASYARGFQLESSFSGWRNRDALKASYAANNGSMDGFDAYVERLREEDRARRKEKIAGDRKTDGAAMPAFSLARYGADQTPVTEKALQGKIGVINFWGVWCGPCVKEIPDIQKFHEAVRGDTGVVFLTVDYNDTPETLDEFMKKRKLTFPVVLDADRWASDKAGISAYPTTLFIDRDGRIAWKHVGASDVVLEEFLWRVELLKGAKAVP